MTERVTDIESNRMRVVAVRKCWRPSRCGGGSSGCEPTFYSPFLNDEAGSAFMSWSLGKNWRRSDRRLNFQAVDDQVIVENTAVDRIHHGMIDPVSVE